LSQDLPEVLIMSNSIDQELGAQMLGEALPAARRLPRTRAVSEEVRERAEPALSLRRAFCLMILGLGLAANGVAAAPSAGGPSDFISGLINVELQALTNKQLNQTDRAKEFRELLEKNFDMPGISRFVLGRYWQEATEPERQHFLQLFEEYVVRSYSQPLSQFSGSTVRVVGCRPEGETMTLVRSEVIGTDGAATAKIDWRVRKDDDGFKILDITLDGVSLVLVQREQLSSVIARVGGVAGLNGQLEQKLGGGSTVGPPLAKRE
jgi:phospholipid transport system substrate-binding protein